MFDVLVQPGDERVPDPAALLDELFRLGVTDVLTGTTTPRVPALPSGPGAPRVHLGVGLWPGRVEPLRLDAQLAALVRVLDEHPVVALSEIGLDGRSGMPPGEAQREAFRRQLRLARERDLVVVVHCVRAWGALFEVLDDVGPPDRWLCHGFTGAPEVAADVVRRGGSVSFGPGLLNPRARRAEAAARGVPADRLLVESDAPSHPPSALPDVVARLAALRGTTAAEVVDRTAENARTWLAHRLP